jgi:hypothetical protein
MKYGPCKRCLVRPVCSTLCDNKIKDLAHLTLADFLKHLRKEGVKIRKIEVVDEPM